MGCLYQIPPLRVQELYGREKERLVLEVVVGGPKEAVPSRHSRTDGPMNSHSPSAQVQNSPSTNERSGGARCPTPNQEAIYN